MLSSLQALIEDYKSIQKNNPASRGMDGILYPGLHAISIHRLIAHPLYRKKFFFIARTISQVSRFLTGIEIHPGARIGRGFFIDHGMGIVVGETAIIGSHVTLYHGVTLGGTGKKVDSDDRRHPKVGDGTIIGAGATILGPITLGREAKVGAGAIVLIDVPDGKTIVGNPGRIVER